MHVVTKTKHGKFHDNERTRLDSHRLLLIVSPRSGNLGAAFWLPCSGWFMPWVGPTNTSRYQCGVWGGMVMGAINFSTQDERGRVGTSVSRGRCGREIARLRRLAAMVAASFLRF